MNKKTIANAIINELRSDYHSFEEISDLATHFSVDSDCDVYTWGKEPRFVTWDEGSGPGQQFDEWLSPKGDNRSSCLQFLGSIHELPEGIPISDLCFEVGLLE